MAKKKGLFDSAIDMMADSSPLFWMGKKAYDMYQEHQESKQEEEQQLASANVDAWSEFIPDMRNYRLQDRKAIMFLPDDDIRVIWNSIMPGDCEIAYIPYSVGTPEGITIEGNHLEEGVLYVYDPRNEFHFYKASEISQVLIKDKFREFKHVFESLGATRIDITFSALKDEKSEYTSNNSQNISGHYGAHKASAGHSGSQGRTNHSSDFRQLEIHKQCTGKTSHINLNNCYWYQNDVIFQDEVRSIKAGATLETNFVDTTKSYSSITSTSMDKIEAEYEYMGTIGVSGMAQWDYSKMQEISQEVVWDVHVVYSNDNINFNKNDITMNTWKDYFNTSSDEYDVINHIWNNFNKRMYSVSDEVAQSDMEFFDELIHNDAEFDSIIIMFKAIIGLTNEDYYNDGKEAIEDALSLDDSLNYNDKYNLQLAYEAKEADSLEEFQRIVSEFKNHKSNWLYVNRLFSYIVSTSLDDGGYALDAFEDDADKKAIQTAYKAFRIKTILPSAQSAADGWTDWVDLCIEKNDDDALYCAQTAYDTYRSMKPAIDHREADYRGTISYGMMGNIIIGLARCYYIGLGTEIDYSKAFGLFTEAYETIQKGDSNNFACSHLAECYTLGHGTKVDLNKAVELYQEEIDNLQKTQSVIDMSSTIENYRSKIKDIQSGKYDNLKQDVKENVNSANNKFKSAVLSDSEQEYAELLKEALARGGMSETERRLLDKIRKQYNISEQRAKELEASLSTPSLSQEEQEYLDAYKDAISHGGSLSPLSQRMLGMMKRANGISEDRAKEIEAMA